MIFGRLKKRRHYVRVSKSSVKARRRSFLLLASRDSGFCSCIRFGITASKRVGSSVVRNKTKRILRSIIHDFEKKQQNSLNALGSLDFVIIAFPSLHKENFQNLTQDFFSAFNACIQNLTDYN